MQQKTARAVFAQTVRKERSEANMSRLPTIENANKKLLIRLLMERFLCSPQTSLPFEPKLERGQEVSPRPNLLVIDHFLKSERTIVEGKSSVVRIDIVSSQKDM